jgi:hypothetical protein
MIKLDELPAELDRLAQTPTVAGRTEVAFSGGVCGCHFETVDRIGCSVHEIQVVLTTAQPDLGRLRQAAERLCNQLRYLVEPLRVIEVDPTEAVIQARSSQPSIGPNGPAYYELLISRQGMRLVRYQVSPGQPRQQVAMHLTREVVLRLVKDLIQAAENIA